MKKVGAHLFARVICVGALSGAALPSITNASESWDVGFQPHVEVGVADYNIDFSAISQFNASGTFSAGKLSFDATMPTLSAGLTLFAESYFLDLSAQRMQTFNQSMSDSHTIVSTPPDFSTIPMEYETDDFSRDEYSLSLGYGITKSVSVYAGYKKQYTNFNQLGGAGLASVNGAAGSTPFANFVTTGDFKFDYDGPFIGGTTRWKIDRSSLKGQLAFSAAIAFLGGSLHVESESSSLTLLNGAPLPTGVASTFFDTSGDATGITLGASWVGQTRLAELSYSVAVNGYSYDFSADDDGRSDISEDVLQLKVGLAYAF